MVKPLDALPACGGFQRASGMRSTDRGSALVCLRVRAWESQAWVHAVSPDAVKLGPVPQGD